MEDKIRSVGLVTLGTDMGYEAKDFVRQVRDRGATSLIAQKQGGRLTGATVTFAYAISQTTRRPVEEILGRFKTVAAVSETRRRGVARFGWMFTIHRCGPDR
jgi:hypothetical protein